MTGMIEDRIETGKRSGRAAAWGVALLLVAGSLSAQEQNEKSRWLPLSFGVAAGYGVSAYSGSVDIGANPAIGGGACGLLDGGGGSGIAAGAFAEYRLTPALSLGVRGLLENYSGVMTADLPTTFLRVGSGAVIPIESQHRMDLDLPVQTFELYAAYAPFAFPLRLSAGPKIGIPSSPSFTFAEEIEGDGEFSFANGTKRQEYASGTADASMIFGLHLGVDYELPLGGPFSLQPGVAFFTHANGIIAGEEGPVVSGLRATIGVHYRLRRPAIDPPIAIVYEPTPPPAPPKPPTPETEALVVTVRPYSIDATGAETDALQVAVKSGIEIDEIPLLPYIFFAKGSSEIPARYSATRSEGTPHSIAVYRDILDILGERMSRGNEKIRVTGTIDGSAAEKSSATLPRDRARAVAVYLNERWGIDLDRVEVATRGLPSTPANPELPGADAENRRVEIETEADYLAPVRRRDTTQTITASPLYFETRRTSGDAITDWRLDLRAGSSTIRDVVGASQLPSRIDATLTQNEVDRLLRPEMIRWSLKATDVNGMTTEESGMMPIERTIEKVERQALENATTLRTPVLFPYNSAVVGAEERATLIAFRDRLPAGSRLLIIGYADDLGATDYNRTLSRRRAEAVATLFTGFDVTIEAAGENHPDKGDATPEARYYERTVNIVVGE